MREINSWDIKNDKHEFDIVTDINELLDKIKCGDIKFFSFSKKYYPGDEINTPVELTCNNQKLIFNYTDSNHPFLLDNNGYLGGNKIDKDFYLKYEKEIKNAFFEYYKNTTSTFFYIPPLGFSNELFDFLLKKDNIEMINFNEINLTDEQLEKLKNKHITIIWKGKTIYNIFLLAYYTKKDFDTCNYFIVNYNQINENNISYFSLIKDNSIVNMSIDSDKDENKYLETCAAIINEVDKYGKKIKFKIRVNKRSLFKKNFNNKSFNNVDLIISNDLHDYSYNEYLKEEEQLENMVRTIKEQDLSPFERYIAVYNIVKNFKPYKENNDDRKQARYLRYILNGDYIVCVGYAKLLECLLDKVDINCNTIGVGVDISYDGGFTLEEKTTKISGHERCIVDIDDENYNIHGLYMADPTWDNNLQRDYLNYALMTFDNMSKNNRMFDFNICAPILDIHNFKEFSDQVNYILRRHISNEIKKNSNNIVKNKMQSIINNAYRTTINNILDTIKCDSKMIYFYDLLEKCTTESDYSNLITELGNYLLTRINIPLNYKKIILANNMVSKKNTDFTTQKEEYMRRDKFHFPYELTDEEHNLSAK